MITSAEGRPVKEKVSRHKTSGLIHTPPPCTSLLHQKPPTNISGGIQRGIARSRSDPRWIFAKRSPDCPPPLAGFQKGAEPLFCKGRGRAAILDGSSRSEVLCSRGFHNPLAEGVGRAAPQRKGALFHKAPLGVWDKKARFFFEARRFYSFIIISSFAYGS